MKIKPKAAWFTEPPYRDPSCLTCEYASFKTTKEQAVLPHNVMETTQRWCRLADQPLRSVPDSYPDWCPLLSNPPRIKRNLVPHSRFKFKIDGMTVGYAEDITYDDSIDYEPVDVLDNINIADEIEIKVKK